MNNPKNANYKESRAIKNHKDSSWEYHGERISYDGYQTLQFQHILGYERIKESGQFCTGEGCGFLKVEIYSNECNKKNPSSFELSISTASGDIINMYDLDVRILKKLNHFLTYALENTDER
tara:strand:+ start:127 stop:489 length:363 start_codon:yes stop_codon:yes gene_type:complete